MMGLFSDCHRRNIHCRVGGTRIDVSPREGSAGFEKTKTLAKTWALASAVELHHLSNLPWSQRVWARTAPRGQNLGRGGGYSRRGTAQVHRLESRGATVLLLWRRKYPRKPGRGRAGRAVSGLALNSILAASALGG